jgi:hypothetical protein
MGYIFDPNALQEIVKKNLNLPLEERLDAIIVGVDKTLEARVVLEKNWVRTFGKEIYAL